ncbi:amino acid ABC transporter permease [Dethiobacter alkaliphilus]|uniref:Polar amino acid ABC transporter, inner membrane subunit n=1 Tax=Dethiobacter alkaliphilus AHT 1 TaxID=555088 RepID=C0GCT3_DETAL|nr:amino acid ABC transporter permease [Dethiobacter alkaliphilus]EEG79018.1 polar amino acid ABC transporter, inner membrane subunit [Dethiobacter alkaliphilus AHT 1]
MNWEFRPEVIVAAMPALLQGMWMTIMITVGGVALGFVLGILFGLGRISKNKIIFALSTTYVEIIRGTPILVQIFFIYFAMPILLGSRISNITAAIAAIAINSGAYLAEIVRGGIQSIDKGQTEAGRTIGMTPFQTMRYIIWPQAFKRIIPPMGNQFIISLKDTSLLSVIAVADLTRRGQTIIAVNYRSVEIWGTVALLYLTMTLTISFVLRRMERRLDV